MGKIRLAETTRFKFETRLNGEVRKSEDSPEHGASSATMPLHSLKIDTLGKRNAGVCWLGRSATCLEARIWLALRCSRTSSSTIAERFRSGLHKLFQELFQGPGQFSSIPQEKQERQLTYSTSLRGGQRKRSRDTTKARLDTLPQISGHGREA